MSTLYTSASGHNVTHVSDSSISDFRFCRRKFKLKRIDGWRQKNKKASLEFGKAIEAAIQYFYANGRKSGEAVTEFKRIWLKFESVTLEYTDQEGDWKTLYTVGSEITALFEILSDNLPIENPKWQLQYEKPMWPGTNLGDLQYQGYVDCLSTLADGTRIIIDIKTAKAPLDATPGMLAMDQQLRKYAWASGVREVGFLNFIKGKPDSLKKGDEVTIIDNSWTGELGERAMVFKFDKEAQTLLLGTEAAVRLMDEELDAIKGKGSTAAKEEHIARAVLAGSLFSVPRAAITKCRMQYLQATIAKEDLADIGQALGEDAFAQKRAWDEQFYPLEGGVRFPNQKCTWCEMRPICLRMGPEKVAETLVQIKPAEAVASDWLTELEQEVSE